jgi:hypothetical protein
MLIFSLAAKKVLSSYFYYEEDGKKKVIEEREEAFEAEFVSEESNDESSWSCVWLRITSTSRV